VNYSLLTKIETKEVYSRYASKRLRKQSIICILVSNKPDYLMNPYWFSLLFVSGLIIQTDGLAQSNSISSELDKSMQATVTGGRDARYSSTQSSAKKTAPNLSRLIAAFTGNGDGTTTPRPFDSASYFYHGGRGGDLKSGLHLPFDTAIFQTFDLTGGAYVMKRCTLKKFDSRSLDTNVLELNYTAGSWVNYKLTRYCYSSLRTDSIVTKYNWLTGYFAPTSEFEYSYSGLTSTETERKWSSTKFENYYKTTTTRDSTGRTIAIQEDKWNTLYQVWEPKRLSGYYYNTNGSLAMSDYKFWYGTWVRNIETHFRYDVKSVLVSTLTYYNWPTGWDKSDSSKRTQDSVTGYTATNTNYTYSPTTGKWSVGQRTINSYTPTKQYASITTQNYDIANGGWINYNTRSMTYNSNDQLLQDSIVFWTSNSWEPFPRNEWRYYYEDYSPPDTTVITTTPDSFLVQLYPIPAAELINISLKLPKPSALNMTVIDAFGRKVAYWHFGPTTNYQDIFSCARLGTGYYTLIIQTEAEKIVRSFLVHR
jgi:hypothetical protein